MPVLQAAWLYYLHHSALVLNALGLFYAVNGSWLLLATQIRTRHRISSPAGISEALSAATQRGNRLFNRVGGTCLGAGLVLSLISTQV